MVDEQQGEQQEARGVERQTHDGGGLTGLGNAQ